ncbi:hypothetical protein CDAR_303811 [Caerostris darwini]|uniref:Uncharacterized protein n=1 Tax=Caerostris darwini TaxID=1538125 RepID=A0AAV4T4S9_9ARAC|nr:hypothetical protein CDAR_303811 [Caerostris darwini]
MEGKFYSLGLREREKKKKKGLVQAGHLEELSLGRTNMGNERVASNWFEEDSLTAQFSLLMACTGHLSLRRAIRWQLEGEVTTLKDFRTSPNVKGPSSTLFVLGYIFFFLLR